MQVRTALRRVGLGLGLVGVAALALVSCTGARSASAKPQAAGPPTVGKCQIFPKDNAKDLRDIPKRVLKAMHLVPVGHMDEVLRAALALGDPAEFLKEPSVPVDWRIPVDRRGGERRGIDARLPVASATPPTPPEAVISTTGRGGSAARHTAPK